jgi:menaquinone-dependent protoporphyrinogen oxidase
MGMVVDTDEVTYVAIDAPLQAYDALVLVASVELSRHEREMLFFVQDHLTQLQGLPTAFLSVSLGEAGAEMAAASPAQRARGAEDARRRIDAFCASTGWRPERVMAVAAPLLYSEYGILERLVVRWMARRMGGSIDTSRDVERTDWAALDRFVDDLVTAFALRTGAAAAAPRAALAG